MNKIPAKQIYLLTIIIVGIIALSVYSTYALFTFESETSNIVSIHTPKSLKISENIYEYRQITIEENSVVTTDIDIYNTFEYDVCYSIWYKIVGDIDEEKVQIFQKSKELLTSSGVLSSLQNIRVTIVIINDNDTEVKINLGTIGEELTSESCSLNLTKDKKVISNTYEKIENLNDKILSESSEVKNEEENYLTYKEENKIITYKDTDKIYVSDKFTYKDELFTLEEPEYITIEDLVEENYLEKQDVYFCKDNNNCSILYKIITLEEQEKETNETTNEETYFNITSYDKLIGYSTSENGMRKVNEQDYIFYGDNPNNYIYYNCKNNDDPSTCELWRIVGLYYNKDTNKYNAKIVKNTSIGKYQYDNTENETLTWTDSTLYKYLTEEYEFTNNYDIYVDEYKQSIEILSSLDTEIKKQEKTLDSKINLLTLSDYLNTSSCKINQISDLTEECIKKNWLNNIELDQSWTLTGRDKPEIIIETVETTPNQELSEEDETTNTTAENETNEENIQETKTIINYVYSIGNNIIENKTTDELEVRPSIYLKSRMLLVAGNGSFENPYVIK